MATDFTRQLSASVYLSQTLGNKVIQFVKNPFNAIVQPPGIDSVLLLKHALNARRRQHTVNWLLLIPAIAFWLSLMTLLIPVAFVCGIIIFLMVWFHDRADKQFIRKHFSSATFNVDFPYSGADEGLIRGLQEKTTKNITYYSGYSPFVGCGYGIGGWSFVIDIDKGKTEMGATATPKAFQEDELYYIVSKELLNLKIEHLSIENKVYFNGKGIRENRDLLPNIFGHPVTEVSSEFIKKAMNSGIEDARFYKIIEVAGWDGDLILTAFLRFQRGERTLFVENNYYLLPPIQEEYRAVDRIKQESGIHHLLTQLGKLIVKTILRSISSIFLVAGYILEGIGSIFGFTPETALKKIVKSSPDYDYGSRTSIREQVSQTNYLQHFQKLDKERYFKTIDKRIFSGIADFLDSKGISTVEFRERETTVLNNGIIVNAGGNLTGGNIATGVGAAISNIGNMLNPNKTPKSNH